MRIYDQNPETLKALNGTNIELMIGVPNEDLEKLTNQNAANTWVNDNILKYSNVNFKYIAVGNEVDPNNESRKYKDYVLPAMQNVHNALRAVGRHNQIKVSTATYTGLLNNTFPPNRAAFRNKEFAEPIVKFLADNKLPMLANIYPYFGYINTEDRFKNLSYALFTAGGTVLKRVLAGGKDVEIVVSESGWPSDNGVEATVGNAGTYYKNLINHVRGTAGTPLKRERSIETYLFAMFDENTKPGNLSERHFGVFSPKKESKYGLSFN
ncbi:putative glucan endo-1,3-beta-D-glucosidase [Helianthus debilis subsp. tardiflorus]